jgi:hypothetical protein
MASIKHIRRLLILVSFATVFLAGSFSRPASSSAIPSKETRNSKSSQTGDSSIQIHLEQKKGEKVVGMRPEHVFEPGDVVRFRLTSGFDGYLYVIDLGSSGTYATLFPAADTSHDNVIHRGVDSLVPSVDDGWFQIDGPAGFDVVYFLVSSTPLDVSAGKGAEGNAAPPHAPDALPSSIKPRCNDAIFQARGECIDDSAGPAPLARDLPLPPQISMVAPTVSRDIIFVADEDDNSVKATAPVTTPVVYIFRLAHH